MKPDGARTNAVQRRLSAPDAAKAESSSCDRKLTVGAKYEMGRARHVDCADSQGGIFLRAIPERFPHKCAAMARFGVNSSLRRRLPTASAGGTAGSFGPAAIGRPTWSQHCWSEHQQWHTPLRDVRSEPSPSVFAPQRQGSFSRDHTVASPSAAVSPPFSESAVRLRPSRVGLARGPLHATDGDGRGSSRVYPKSFRELS